MGVVIDNEQLNALLRELDSSLGQKVRIVAYGGTSLTLLGLKPSSEDIDLIVEGNKQVRDAVKRLLTKQAGVRVDISPKGRINPFYVLPPDYSQRSAVVNPKRKFKRIDLHALDPLDVLVSKIGRWNSRDQKDAQDILRQKGYQMHEIEVRFGLFVRGYQRDKQKFMDKFRLFEQMYEEEFGGR